MMTENKSIVDTVNKAFDDNDTEAFLACCAEDVIWIMPGSNICNGKESILEMMKDFPAETPLFNIKDMIAENDMVMCRGDMKMKDKEGNYADYVFCDVYLFKEKKIVEITTYIIKQKL